MIFNPIETKIKIIPYFFGMAGVTVYPYIFSVNNNVDIAHEEIHIDQQYKWYKWGWHFGTLAWLFCYLFLLPIGWNPFRYNWEADAYTYTQVDEVRESTPDWVKNILKKYYYLWF